MTRRFFACHPEIIEERWCEVCFVKTRNLLGVEIDQWGISFAMMCLECENLKQEKDTANPFDGLNSKLDRLLRWAGME